MRTNIVIDDKLMKDALRATGLKTKREVVELGLRKTIDTIIATRCIESGDTLLHCDRDFEPFVTHLGLRTVL